MNGTFFDPYKATLQSLKELPCLGLSVVNLLNNHFEWMKSIRQSISTVVVDGS